MLPRRVPSDTAPEKEKDERRKIIIALLFLLLSFSCIFCSSQSALWFIDRNRIEASMLPSKNADYGAGPAIALAPLEGDIAAEANRDEELLLLKQTPIAGGLGVVTLPNPIPTPAPTLVAILPTPILTPTVSTPSSGAPTPIPIAPTSTPNAATPAAPTAPLPTLPPSTLPPPTFPPPTGLPTVPPTSLPPTQPPPTSPPPTSLPPTSPPPPATPIPPMVFFAAPSFNINENAGVAFVTVNLSTASASIVTVNYTTSDGTTTAGSDYTGTSGLLTFTPGITSQTFPVTILDDTLDELDETIFLALSAPTNATLGTPNPATLTIVDNDNPPTVQFSTGSYTVNENAGTASITVNLSEASALAVTANYTTSDGTATAGSDYTGTSGLLTFAPGVTSQTFPVPILDDTLDELDETVALALSAPTNATLGAPNLATLTIVDNDALPTVQFSSPTYTVIEAGGSAPITVTLSAVSGLTVTVDFATGDNTATAGSDYLAATGTLTFTPGITSQIFLVTISDDNLDEPGETVRLTLANPTNASPGATIIAILTIIDDENPPPADLCSGVYPSGEPNIGSPNGNSVRVACDVGMIIDLGASITVLGDNNPDFDLIYYEVQGVGGPDPPPPPYYIYMDLVQVQIGQTPSGPWFTIFEWGDNITDANTNIGGTYADGGASSDNLIMFNPPLIGPGDPLNTGIQIDVDNLPVGLPAVPAGTYQYIRIYSPLSGANDGPEVDAIQVLP